MAQPPQRVSIELADNGVAQVRLTRGDKMNALDPAMFDALIAAGERLQALPGLRAVVLSGEGRAFCAGLDLAALAAAGGPDAITGGDLMARTHGAANRPQQAAMTWRKCPVPVIAAIHGACLGGGLQIAGGADVRVVHPAARLAVMEMKWGLVPDMGGFALWRALVRADALRELTYTNREFSGEEALALGFATMLDDDPLARATALAATIAARSPAAIRAAKRLFAAAQDAGEEAILLAESREQAAILGTANQLEAVAAHLTGRPPAFTDP